jgi:hypothetical protein
MKWTRNGSEDEFLVDWGSGIEDYVMGDSSSCQLQYCDLEGSGWQCVCDTAAMKWEYRTHL